jgi:predicted transposase/invertase (TIGR01784 family)
MSDIEYKLLDPKIDYVFKRIFGEKGDENILMSLINSILKGNPVINELKLLNTEYPKEGVITKGCQFDILAKTDNGTTINIEMQYRNNKNINDRIVYYSDRLNVS